MEKKILSETDIVIKYILPAVGGAGREKLNQLREEVKLHDGKVLVHGQLGMLKRQQRDIATQIDDSVTLCDQLEQCIQTSQATQKHFAGAAVENALGQAT